MRELTVTEQESVNGGGWNWWDVTGGVCTIGGAISTPFCAPLAIGLDALGGVCDIMGADNNN